MEGSLDMLKEIKKRSAAYKFIHFDAFNYKRKMYFGLNIPIMILGVITTTMTFYGIQSSTGSDLAVDLVMGMIDVSVLVLSGLSTFLQYGQKSTTHQQNSQKFSKMILKIDKLLMNPNKIDGEAADKIMDKYTDLVEEGCKDLTQRDMNALSKQYEKNKLNINDLVDIV